MPKTRGGRGGGFSSRTLRLIAACKEAVNINPLSNLEIETQNTSNIDFDLSMFGHSEADMMEPVKNQQICIEDYTTLAENGTIEVDAALCIANKTSTSGSIEDQQVVFTDQQYMILNDTSTVNSFLPNIATENIFDASTISMPNFDEVELDDENDPEYVMSDNEFIHSDDDSIDDTNKGNNTEISEIEQSSKEADDSINVENKIKPFSKKAVQSRKIKRNSGKAYITAKGVHKKDRSLKPLVECRNKCKEKLTDDIRNDIFKEYWLLGTYDRRTAYIAGLIYVKNTAITRNRLEHDERKKRNRLHSYIYNFEIKGERLVVCKKCFLATLDETEKFIVSVIANKLSSNSGTTYSDKRGLHTPSHKTSVEKINEVMNHIKSFPAYQSHYSRRHTDKYYLASNLNLNVMYRLYCEKHEQPVSTRIYNREFHNLNLRFKKPKIDTCTNCDQLQAQIKYLEGEDKEVKRKEHERHMDMADLAYLKKKEDKEIGQNDDSYVTYTFDLQQVLQTPYLTSDKVFYLRQLSTYNLTIHNCISGDSCHYMWHEAVGGRGANDIASCLFKHLQKIPANVKTVVFYSDTCGGQNKNSHVSAMFQYALQNHPSLEVIDHKFLIPGHTHMECDVDHAAIERKKKKCPFPIHTPRDWYQLVRTTGQKHTFEVDVMDQANFYSFSTLLKGPLQQKTLNVDRESFNWRNVCWLRYQKYSNTVKYKTALDDSDFKEVSFLRKGKKINNLTSLELAKLYTGPKLISEKKKKDLLALLPFLDKDVHQFYIDLPTEVSNEDMDPDIDRYFSDSSND